MLHYSLFSLIALNVNVQVGWLAKKGDFFLQNILKVDEGKLKRFSDIFSSKRVIFVLVLI